MEEFFSTNGNGKSYQKIGRNGYRNKIIKEKVLMINETIKRRIAEWLPYRAVKKKLEFSPQLGQLAKESPQLYNMYGEPMKMFFLKDKVVLI